MDLEEWQILDSHEEYDDKEKACSANQSDFVPNQQDAIFGRAPCEKDIVKTEIPSVISDEDSVSRVSCQKTRENELADVKTELFCSQGIGAGSDVEVLQVDERMNMVMKTRKVSVEKMEKEWNGEQKWGKLREAMCSFGIAVVATISVCSLLLGFGRSIQRNNNHKKNQHQRLLHLQSYSGDEASNFSSSLND